MPLHRHTHKIQCRKCQLLSNYWRNICKTDRFTERFTADPKKKKILRVFARNHLMPDQQPPCTFLIPESGNFAAWILLLLVFLSGYLSLAAAFWSAAHPVFITRTAIWIASGVSHPILPSLDSKHPLQMPTNSQEKVLLQAIGSLLFQAWMRSRKTACSTSQPYAASSSSLSPAPSPSCCHTGCARQSLFSEMPGSEWGREGWWKGRGKGD